MKLPEIPQTYLVAALLVTCIAMRWFGIDSWTTATLGILAGYITGKHVEQARKEKEPVTTDGV